MSYWYDLNDDGEIIPLDDAPTTEQLANRWFLRDHVGDKMVSTVFLMVDHSYDGGAPLLFETMIFDKNGNSDYMQRYSNIDCAKRGHQYALRLIKEEQK